MQLHSNSPTLQTAAPKAPNNALNATIPFKFMDSHQNFKYLSKPPFIRTHSKWYRYTCDDLWTNIKPLSTVVWLSAMSEKSPSWDKGITLFGYTLKGLCLHNYVSDDTSSSMSTMVIPVAFILPHVFFPRSFAQMTYWFMPIEPAAGDDLLSKAASFPITKGR